jgi:urea transporter
MATPQNSAQRVFALAALRGVGQVIFQENALTGACFLAGIAASSPLMAAGAAVGALIGTATATSLRFDETERTAGIYGFNSTLVGIATLFYFKPGAASLALLAVGCIAAAALTRWMRRQVPFPTYTMPFILTVWVIYFAAPHLGATRVESPAAVDASEIASRLDVFKATTQGVAQVMFQASIWTGLLFLLGLLVSNRQHAACVLAGSVIGMLLSGYHATLSTRALDPETLVDRSLFENIELGLYGYNATLAALSLFLWRRSLLPILIGSLLSVPLTEAIPMVGLPALTAPFVLAAWIVQALGWLDSRLFEEPAPQPS